VHDDGAEKLNVIMALPDGPSGGLAGGGESLGQELV